MVVIFLVVLNHSTQFLSNVCLLKADQRNGQMCKLALTSGRYVKLKETRLYTFGVIFFDFDKKICGSF